MWPRLLLWFILLLPGALRAEATAPAARGTCVAAKVEAKRLEPGAAALHRIVFVNQCEEPRSLFWCAEHPASALPLEIACPPAAGGAFVVEARHSIQRRREFQWYLPSGTRIRFQDCPGEELPTSDFGCAPPSAAAPRR